MIVTLNNSDVSSFAHQITSDENMTSVALTLLTTTTATPKKRIANKKKQQRENPKKLMMNPKQKYPKKTWWLFLLPSSIEKNIRINKWFYQMNIMLVSCYLDKILTKICKTEFWALVTTSEMLVNTLYEAAPTPSEKRRPLHSMPLFAIKESL